MCLTSRCTCKLYTHTVLLPLCSLPPSLSHRNGQEEAKSLAAPIHEIEIGGSENRLRLSCAISRQSESGATNLSFKNEIESGATPLPCPPSSLSTSHICPSSGAALALPDPSLPRSPPPLPLPSMCDAGAARACRLRRSAMDIAAQNLCKRCRQGD
jgi:hypothetical protein